MRVLAFAPALRAVDAPGGGVDAAGFPMTSCVVEALPAEITIQVVISVATRRGEDSRSVRFLTVTAPDGGRVATMQFGWRWDDDPDIGVKFRAFVQYLPVWVDTPGVYTLGLTDEAEGGVVEASYPLPIFQANNPFLVPRAL